MSVTRKLCLHVFSPGGGGGGERLNTRIVWAEELRQCVLIAFYIP